MRNGIFIGCIGAVALVAAACAGDSIVETPDLGTKGDALRQVNERGMLFFGEAQTHHITSDFQFDGFRILVGQDSTVTLETTHLGSSQGFDTTVFVYGPRTPSAGFGDDFIAMDDNSGFSPLSRLQSVDLAAGEYLVVVGTPNALGRGRYRLLASCESGDCGPQESTLSDDERDDVLEILNFDCVFQSCDGDFGWSAGDASCDFDAESCRIGFSVSLFAFETDQVVLDAAVGATQTAVNPDGKSFTATIAGVDGDVDGDILDFECELDGYESAARVLESSTRLRDDFESHVLDCVFLIEDMAHELVE